VYITWFDAQAFGKRAKRRLRLNGKEKADTDWWGEFALPQEQKRYWRIGPLQLWVEYFPGELRVHYLTGRDPLEARSQIGVETAEAIPEEATTLRFAGRSLKPHIWLEPALADRFIVVRPEVAFQLLPGEKMSIYITTPLWVRLRHRKEEAAILDIPTFRPSDTWFGPSTVQGELCYAGRTHARLQLKEVPLHPARAVTTVFLENRADAPLLLEHLNTPLPFLELYRDGEGDFWTQSIDGVWQRAPAQGIKVTLAKGAPARAQNARKVMGPRRRGQANMMVRAFKSLLG
jgi:hypothetical protein